MRYREFVLSPYGVIKIKSLGYNGHHSTPTRSDRSSSPWGARDGKQGKNALFAAFPAGVGPDSHSEEFGFLSWHVIVAEQRFRWREPPGLDDKNCRR
ncbi:hypothetical protein [Symbiopectobacterium purcellii]|uniref:hypothetical protein n=1 Tax=Symbiopectobacterium purcellii TaxID=2871826 RepID=UPI003F871951